MIPMKLDNVGKAKPQSVTKNSYPSGRTLILVLLRLRIQGRRRLG